MSVPQPPVSGSPAPWSGPNHPSKRARATTKAAGQLHLSAATDRQWKGRLLRTVSSSTDEAATSMTRHTRAALLSRSTLSLESVRAVLHHSLTHHEFFDDVSDMDGGQSEAKEGTFGASLTMEALAHLKRKPLSTPGLLARPQSFPVPLIPGLRERAKESSSGGSGERSHWDLVRLDRRNSEINASILKAEGLSDKHIERLYNVLLVYSIGFHQVVREVMRVLVRDLERREEQAAADPAQPVSSRSDSDISSSSCSMASSDASGSSHSLKSAGWSMSHENKPTPPGGTDDQGTEVESDSAFRPVANVWKIFLHLVHETQPDGMQFRMRIGEAELQASDALRQVSLQRRREIINLAEMERMLQREMQVLKTAIQRVRTSRRTAEERRLVVTEEQEYQAQLFAELKTTNQNLRDKHRDWRQRYLTAANRYGLLMEDFRTVKRLSLLQQKTLSKWNNEAKRWAVAMNEAKTSYQAAIHQLQSATRHLQQLTGDLELRERKRIAALEIASGLTEQLTLKGAEIGQLVSSTLRCVRAREEAEAAFKSARSYNNELSKTKREREWDLKTLNSTEEDLRVNIAKGEKEEAHVGDDIAVLLRTIAQMKEEAVLKNNEFVTLRGETETLDATFKQLKHENEETARAIATADESRSATQRRKLECSDTQRREIRLFEQAEKATTNHQAKSRRIQRDLGDIARVSKQMETEMDKVQRDLERAVEKFHAEETRLTAITEEQEQANSELKIQHQHKLDALYAAQEQMDATQRQHAAAESLLIELKEKASGSLHELQEALVRLDQSKATADRLNRVIKAHPQRMQDAEERRATAQQGLEAAEQRRLEMERVHNEKMREQAEIGTKLQESLVQTQETLDTESRTKLAQIEHVKHKLRQSVTAMQTEVKIVKLNTEQLVQECRDLGTRAYNASQGIPSMRRFVFSCERQLETLDEQIKEAEEDVAGAREDLDDIEVENKQWAADVSQGAQALANAIHEDESAKEALQKAQDEEAQLLKDVDYLRQNVQLYERTLRPKCSDVQVEAKVYTAEAEVQTPMAFLYALMGADP